MDSCIDLFLWRATENCGDWSEIELQGEGKATPQKDYDNILVASFQFRNFSKLETGSVTLVITDIAVVSVKTLILLKRRSRAQWALIHVE